MSREWGQVRSTGVTFDYTIPSFGGLSKEFKMNNGAFKPNHYAFTLMTTEDNDEPSLKFRYDWRGSGISVNNEWIEDHHVGKVSKGLVSFSGFYGEESSGIRMNITNIGLKSSKVKIKFQPLCKEYSLNSGVPFAIQLQCSGGCRSSAPAVFIFFKDNNNPNTNSVIPVGVGTYFHYDDQEDIYPEGYTPWDLLSQKYMNENFGNISLINKYLVCQQLVDSRGILDYSPRVIPLIP